MTQDINRQIRKSREVLQNPYAYLNGEGTYDALAHDKPALIDRSALLGGKRRGHRFERQDIEAIVRNLQIQMWRRRTELLETEGDVEPLQILDPIVALKCLGYRVAMRESLGLYAAGKDSFEVAGLVDNANGTVQISRRFSPPSRRFTAAHELGHAVLHEGSGLHRDRAPDGSGLGPRDLKEREADTFASLFLLPEKQVRVAFQNRFRTPAFKLNDATAFALASKDLRQVQNLYRGERELARALATAHHYDGVHFDSLVGKFQVSVEVMAIRLEELALVKLA
jgi:Zn-dependent peptidase ImmA (M78 family)